MAKVYVPQIEKRILPLLDITVIMLGILILLIGNPQLGAAPVLVLEIAGDRIVHGTEVVATGGDVDEDAATAVIRSAHASGFGGIEILIPDQAHELSASHLASIERQLKQIAILVAAELQTRSLTVRTTSQTKNP